MSTILRVALVLLCAFLTGCVPESKNPIASPSQSFLDQRLEGDWQAREDGGSPAFYHFGHKKSIPWMRIVGVERTLPQGVSVSTWDALSTRIGSHTYLSFRGLSEDGKSVQASYNFARYDFDWLGRLRIHLIDESAVIDAVRAGKLRGIVKGKGYSQSVKLTDTSARISAFIATSDPKKLFDGKPMVLRKVQ